MFGTVFILHVLQKDLLVLGSTECLVLRIIINSLVTIAQWSQLPERFEDMCGDNKHAHCWRHCSIELGQLMSSQLHSEEQFIFPFSLLLNHSSPLDIHTIEYVSEYWGQEMQCECMPLCHPHSPILKLPHYFDDILHNGPCNISWENWHAITWFGILEPLANELTLLLGAPNQLDCWVPRCLHIHSGK